MSSQFLSAVDFNVRVTSRPPLAVKVDPARDAAFKYNRAASDMVSYEDLLVAQYLEQLRKTNAQSPPQKERKSSPYLQRLSPSTNSCPIHSPHRGKKQRPASAVRLRPQSGHKSKPKIDAKFIADPNLWDPATPRDGRSPRPTSAYGKRRHRPASAPSKRVRPWSGMSWGRLSSRPSSARRTKALYKEQPRTIVATSFKNGSREDFARVAAPNMKMLLEICTDKLHLGFAGRRVFLEDGIEIFTAEDIPKDGEIYISMGENYKCPYTNARRNTILKNGAAWTMTGVVLPEEGKKKKTTPKLSKRMRALLDTKKVRIVVFRNGMSAESVEVVADLANMEEFLTGCTMRLDLRSHAKIVYDWTGNKVTDLTDTPIIDSCLQPGGTPVLGPVWVSTGEGFDPKGAYDYNIYLKQVVKKRLKDTKTYKSNLMLAKDDKDQVTIPSILSMSDDEIYEALDIAENEVDQLEEVRHTLNSNIKYLEPLLREKEDAGSQYTMKHIRYVEFDDRLVGSRGLKLKVYENGLWENQMVFYFNLREAVKGIKNDKDKIMERLLDELSTSQRTMNTQNPKISPLAKKLYDEGGNEITDVRSLEYGQEVWISFGEPFIVPFTYCLQVQFGIVEGYELDDGRQVVLTKFVDRNDKPLEGKDNPVDWEACEGFPGNYDFRHMTRPEEISYVNGLLEEQELELGAHFLQNTKETNMVIHPEVAVSRKLPGERCDKTGFILHCSWQSESQIFAISKGGFIYCKSMPKLCLGVSDFRVEVAQDKEVDEAGEGEATHSEGLAVLLQRKTSDNPNQRWTFNTDGTISSVAYPDLCLTYLGGQFQGHLNYSGPNKNIQGLKPGNKVVLILADKLSSKDASSQRFALKQEKLQTIGQWKHTDVANNEWKKLAYSWPVKQDGELNEDYIWPLETFLMVNAPNPAKKLEKKTKLSGTTPLRLSALRNGEREKTSAVLVVGPNLSNWMNATTMKHDKESGRHGKQKSRGREEPPVPSEVDVDMSLHCHDVTIRQLEFSMFLDSCTALLDLPFAARRLFDEKGNEHFSLQDLKRDQLIYASCGEPWIDPSVTKAEQQRRFLLSQLSQDISQMRHYCALRNPISFNLEVECLAPNARLLINTQWSRDQEQEDTTQSENYPFVESYDNSKQSADIDVTMDDNLTSHERSHLKSNDRLNRLKWPWERLVNAGADFDSDDPEATKYTDKQMYEKFKPKVSPRMPRDSLQKFQYQDGYIVCESNPDLVLGILQQEGRVKEVILVKKRSDDINQRWIIKDTGEIRCKHNQQLVLTVVMPRSPLEDADNDQPLTFVGSAVTLQARKTSQYGRANQLWHYDADTGYIAAFHTNELDKEITAANTVDVCTYTVAGFSSLTQPGYQVQVPGPAYTDSQRQIKVCMSCARAMRGRCKVERLAPHASFACAMGQAKKQKLKQVGSFRVLNGKVDLSRHEAEHTLNDWEDVLTKLKTEMNIRSIAKGISAAKTVRPIRILAYKNGEGRLNAGEVIIGSSVQGILQQCTMRLSLSSHATRLYTEDGTLILDIQDLVEWASDNYKSAMYKQVDRLIQQQQHGETGLAEEGEDDEDEEDGDDKKAQGTVARESVEKNEVEVELETAIGSLNLVQEEQTRQDGEGANSDDTLDKNKAQAVGFNTEDILSKVPLPSLDVIMRYPVEIWVSTGKPFVSPEVIESREESRKKKRAFRSAVSVELDMERHILRQIKGRRFGEQTPGSYKGTRNSVKPVVLEGHWQEVGTDEQLTHEKVNKLESHLAEVKANQEGSLKTVNVSTTRRLYKQPNTKRVMVFPNGETLERAVYIWGGNMDQLLDEASVKLNLWRRIRCFFTLEGGRVELFDDVDKDQILCASTGYTFKHPPASRQDVEVKANWSRARKQYGPTATDYKVDVAKNPQVNVDPFGPPELALPLKNQTLLPPSTPVPNGLNSARMASDVSA